MVRAAERAAPGTSLSSMRSAPRDHPSRVHRAKALAAARSRRRAIPHHARHLARLRAGRPPAGAAGAPRAAAGRAADRPRGRPHPADLGRGRRRRRIAALDRGPAATRATSSRGRTCSRTARSSSSCCAPPAAGGAASPSRSPRCARACGPARCSRARRRSPPGTRPDARGVDARRARRAGREEALGVATAQPDGGRCSGAAARRSGAGARCAQGRAASSCAATCSSVSSPSGLPTIWTLVGRPSSPKPSGTMIAGWPVTLNSDVNGRERARAGEVGHRVARRRPLQSPIASGRSASAGVSSRSYSAKKATIAARQRLQLRDRAEVADRVGLLRLLEDRARAAARSRRRPAGGRRAARRRRCRARPRGRRRR